MSLLNQIAEVSHPAKFGMIPPDARRNLYTFCKTSVPRNKAELEKAEIETVIANSFDDCFRQRPRSEDVVSGFCDALTLSPIVQLTTNKLYFYNQFNNYNYDN